MGMEPKCFLELKSTCSPAIVLLQISEVELKLVEKLRNCLKQKKKTTGNKKQVQLEVIGKSRRKGR